MGTKYFYTMVDDALSKPWDKDATFCNPPYGLKIGEWVKKGSLDSIRYGVTIVMLLSARVDTRWFHDYIYKKEPDVEIRFLRGRLRFEGTSCSAPFPSMVCIFRGK